MIRKYIIEGPDKHEKIHIIEVDEDKSTRTRHVVRFICEVSRQETPKETMLLAYEILGKLNA